MIVAVDEHESMQDALQLAAFSFQVDIVTAEVSTAFDEASIPVILLKGPGIAAWLYTGDWPRLYGDSDLLVRRQDWDDAQRLIESLGFEDDLGPLEHPRMESGAGYSFNRPSDGASVDLHCMLFGIETEPESLWAAISETAVRESVGGAEVALPSRAFRLLHIALHAVQHGGENFEKPRQDLEMAIAHAPRETWVEARELARRLEATDTFGTGLRLLPEGNTLAAELDVGGEKTLRAELRLNWVPLAEGYQELAEANGFRRKFEILIREAFPNPAFMRWWSPLARRSTPGLILAYIWRPIWLAYRAVPGYLAWRRAARQAR